MGNLSCPVSRSRAAPQWTLVGVSASRTFASSATGTTSAQQPPFQTPSHGSVPITRTMLILTGLLAISLVVGNSASTELPGEVLYSHIFTTDVQIGNHLQSAENTTTIACGHLCHRTANCKSFGFCPGRGSCWLYDHVVTFTKVNGLAAPGTLYYWLLSLRCPTERNYTLGADVCFKVLDTSVGTWQDAKDACREEGGHLLIADSAEKVALVKGRANVLWLGASDAETEGDWRWEDGSVLPVESELWAAGQPWNLDGQQHYLSMSGQGEFGDRKLTPTAPHHPACQIPFWH